MKANEDPSRNPLQPFRSSSQTQSSTTYSFSSSQRPGAGADFFKSPNSQASYGIQKSNSGAYDIAMVRGSVAENVKRSTPSEILLSSPNTQSYVQRTESGGQLGQTISSSISGLGMTSPSGNLTGRPTEKAFADLSLGGGSITVSYSAGKPPISGPDFEYRKTVAEGFRSEK